MLNTPYFRELISVFPNGAAELFSAVAERIDADRSLRGIFRRYRAYRLAALVAASAKTVRRNTLRKEGVPAGFCNSLELL
ncbi:MAG: hypothetical protein IJU96_06090 [Clostridia bacterium]|nr:hypothetical protein [Clostridia bacterium]